MNTQQQRERVLSLFASAWLIIALMIALGFYVLCGVP